MTLENNAYDVVAGQSSLARKQMVHPFLYGDDICSGGVKVHVYRYREARHAHALYTIL